MRERSILCSMRRDSLDGECKRGREEGEGGGGGRGREEGEGGERERERVIKGRERQRLS